MPSPFVKTRGGGAAPARVEPAIVDAVKSLNPERYEIDPDPDIPVPSGDAEDAEWEEYFSHLEEAASLRTGIGLAVKHVNWDAPDDGKPIGIAFIGDIHAGANIDYKRFRSVIEAIANTDGLYAVCMGDVWENAKHLSKAGNALYTSVFASPKDQFEYIKRRFAICRDKWIVLLSGNHDSRDYATAGIDRFPELCEGLGVPYMDESGGTLSLGVGTQRYIAGVKHTWRGKSQLNKTNLHRRFWDEWHEWQNCDIVATAHLHDPISHSEMRKGRAVAYIQTGAFKTKDAWAEMQGFKPSFGVPVVLLYPDSHMVIPLPGSHFDEAVRLLTAIRG